MSGQSTTYSTSYAGEIQALKNFLHTRLAWLDNNMPGFCNPTFVGENEDEAKKLVIYPSPAKERIVIESNQIFDDRLQICLTDLAGKVVARWNGNLLRTGNESFVLDVQKIPAGMWILIMDDGHSHLSGRVVINR